MTRINTNVSSLTAQTRLQRTNNDLQTSLTRLSTGLRINTGKDDPAGLIASESLRSDITSINKALSNTQRANQIIGTADSALGQVSSLLNDVRGLVTEAANKGALSDDEIAANQLQIDSSLEAINRIAQTTTFQGRRLLDGSLDFVTKAGAGFGTVADLRIDQANLGATGSVNVEINVSAAATKASITSTGITASTAASQATGKISFDTPAADGEATLRVSLGNANVIGSEASGTVTLANSVNNAGFANEATTGTGFTLGSGIKLNITAVDGGVADGAVGSQTILNVTTTTSGTSSATYDANTRTLNLVLNQGDNEATVAGQLNTALASKFTVAAGGGAGSIAAGDAGVFTGKFSTVTDNIVAGTFKLSAVNGGRADGAKGNLTTIQFTAGGSNNATYDADNNRILVTAAAGATVSDIVSTINTNLGADFLASNTTNGASTHSVSDNIVNSATLLGGQSPTAVAQFDIQATNGGLADGTKANTTKLVFAAGTTNTSSALFDVATNELRVTVGKNNTVNQVISAINTDNKFQVTGSTLNGTSLFNAADLGTKTPTVLVAGTDTQLKDEIIVTSKSNSSAFNKNISFATDNSLATGVANASLDSSGNIVIKTKGTGSVAVSTIRDSINTLADYSATLGATAGDGIYTQGVGGDAAPTITNLTGGSQGGGLEADLVFQLTGTTGAQVFQFSKGTALNTIIQSVNSSKDATGIEAVADGNNLKLTSVEYGSRAVAAIEVTSEGAGGTFKSGLTTQRANGTDIQATVNGFRATGNGNSLSVNTSTLSLNLTVAAGSNSSVKFDITGGGALFQLGGDVVSNQQARLGIGSLNTTKLGGVNGKLFELVEGGSKSLVNDVTAASKVVDEVISKVTSLRGRLGAFQRTALESNTVSLNDTLSNLNEAQSSIRDADFAKESANLTRAQILVQSGTSVLGIANQSSQSVLSLLR
jgi:flagellin